MFLTACLCERHSKREWMKFECSCVFAAVAFCSMYSCYMSVFLSQTAAVSNTTSCLSEWCSLCHKYFIMPLGICPRPLKTRTQTLLFDFSALNFQWVYSQSVAGVRKAFCLMSVGICGKCLSSVVCYFDLGWHYIYIKRIWTIFLISNAISFLSEPNW